MYRTAAQINSAIHLLSQWFPDYFLERQMPENSVEGRPVFALRLRAGAAGSRPGVLVAGGTHARELMNPDAIVDLAIDLFLSYVNGTAIVYGGRTWTADDIKIILESLDIWLLPCVNPDGREQVIGGDSLWRKNRRVNAGSTCLGVDLNRNADIVWGVAQGQTSCSPCTDIYCGPSAFSEPETRNVKHLLDTERMVSFVDVHSYSELVLYPWGHAPTQSKDSSNNFATLATHTCTASVPGTYSEYMLPVDAQRFTTVARQIVSDIHAVRGRNYTAATSRALYATTGTQSDYAYARHLADTSLYKTYGFTFETGPPADTVDNSFHPADPSLIQRDAKSAIVSLLQQSVCAIEVIGLPLFSGGSMLMSLRGIRDRLLATTAPGREWVALFERLQFPMLSKVLRSPSLAKAAAAVLKSAGHLIENKETVVDAEAVSRASAFVRSLRAGVTDQAIKSDLAAVLQQIDQLKGRKVEAIVTSLMRLRVGKVARRKVASKKKRRVTPAVHRPARPK